MDQKIIKIHVTKEPDAIEVGIHAVSAGAIDAHNKESDYPYKDYSLKSVYVVAIRISEGVYKNVCSYSTIEEAKNHISNTENEDVKRLLSVHRACLVFDNDIVDETKIEQDARD